MSSTRTPPAKPPSKRSSPPALKRRARSWRAMGRPRLPTPPRARLRLRRNKPDLTGPNVRAPLGALFVSAHAHSDAERRFPERRDELQCPQSAGPERLRRKELRQQRPEQRIHHRPRARQVTSPTPRIVIAQRPRKPRLAKVRGRQRSREVGDIAQPEVLFL